LFIATELWKRIYMDWWKIPDSIGRPVREFTLHTFVI
jgi:hypothetical protein